MPTGSPPAGDGDDDFSFQLEAGAEFDFPLLVAQLHMNWRLLVVALVSIQGLNEQVGVLSTLLPKYVQHSADDELKRALLALCESYDLAVRGLEIGQAANQELAACFRQLSQGMDAAQKIHEAAIRVGYGHA